MRVLVACEFSGTVRDAFNRWGHRAWSCDVLPASGDHLQCDALYAMTLRSWDLIVAHPPCTALCSSGARWWKEKRADGRQQAGIDFFNAIVAGCETNAARWAVENPIGIMSTLYRKPDQIIQPWQFGTGEIKATCLWLGNLEKLVPTDIVAGREARIHRMSESPTRGRDRSIFEQGFADAMAEQWGCAPERVA